jgi:tetratricopeptide (TPR) repeat protein
MAKLSIITLVFLIVSGCAQMKKVGLELSYKEKEDLFSTQNEIAYLKELKDPFYSKVAKGSCLTDWSKFVTKQKKALIKIKDNEKKANIWAQLGSCYIFIGQYKNAFFYYDLALSFSGKRNQGKSKLLSNIGLVYEKLGLPVMARSYFEQSLTAYPNNSFANLKLGMSHLRMGDFAIANKIFKRLLKRYPKSRVLRSTLGVSFALSRDFDSLRSKVFPFFNEKDIEKVLFEISIKVLDGKLSESDFSDLKDLEPEKQILKNFQTFLIKEIGRKNGKEKI